MEAPSGVSRPAYWNLFQRFPRNMSDVGSRSSREALDTAPEVGDLLISQVLVEAQHVRGQRAVVLPEPELACEFHGAERPAAASHAVGVGGQSDDCPAGEPWRLTEGDVESTQRRPAIRARDGLRKQALRQDQAGPQRDHGHIVVAQLDAVSRVIFSIAAFPAP